MKTVQATIEEIKKIYGQPVRVKDGIMFIKASDDDRQIPHAVRPLQTVDDSELSETVLLDFTVEYQYYGVECLMDNLDDILKDMRTENTTENRYKPFDLEKAKAGESVVTRDGQKVTILSTELRGDRPIVAIVHGSHTDKVRTYLKNGRDYAGGESYLDLVMQQKETTKWFNIYFETTEGKYITSDLFDTEGEAATMAELVENGNVVLRLVKRCVSVTFED